MKCTGIIRRIDDLGRVVIPREIRRTMKLREGDPLEIFIVDDGVLFKRYNVEENLIEQIERFDKNIQDESIELGIEKTTKVRDIIKEIKTILSGILD